MVGPLKFVEVGVNCNLFRIKQGRIHDSISRVRVGRGFDAVYIAFRQKFQQRDRRTNQRTDRQSDLLQSQPTDSRWNL